MHFCKTLHIKLIYDIRYMMYWVGIWGFVVKHIWKYQACKILNSNAVLLPHYKSVAGHFCNDRQPNQPLISNINQSGN